nr:B12-binding domain-containing radical SAM protein [Desulfobacula sp.]
MMVTKMPGYFSKIFHKKTRKPPLLIYAAGSRKNVICSSYYPIGLAYIAAALEKLGIEVDVLDLNIRPLNGHETEMELRKRLPDNGWVGISGGINSYPFIRELVRLIKNISAVPIVLGGAMCKPNPGLLLKTTGADICCIGEGENTVTDLAQYFEGKMKIDDVLGICFLRDGQVVLQPQRPFQKNLDDFDYPKFSLFDIDTYKGMPKTIQKEGMKSMTLIAGRGCPSSCRFCSPTFGRKIRMRSVNNVITEMEMLINAYTINHFEFCDEQFLFSEVYVRDFCNEIISRNLNITWYALGRVNVVSKFDEETLALIKKSGCHWIGFGMESGSQRILDLMKKGISTAQIETTVNNVRKAGISVTGTFILGFPGENNESIRETIDFCKKIVLPVPSFTFCCPLPGADIYKNCIESGKIVYEKQFWESLDAPLWELVMNLTDFSDEELIRLKASAENEINEHAKSKGRVGWFG